MLSSRQPAIVRSGWETGCWATAVQRVQFPPLAYFCRKFMLWRGQQRFRVCPAPSGTVVCVGAARQGQVAAAGGGQVLAPPEGPTFVGMQTLNRQENISTILLCRLSTPTRKSAVHSGGHGEACFAPGRVRCRADPCVLACNVKHGKALGCLLKRNKV